MINQLLHNKVVSRENLIEKTHLITEKLVNAAQSFIKLYREYRNGVLSESELIDAVEPLNWNKVISHIRPKSSTNGQMRILN